MNIVIIFYSIVTASVVAWSIYRGTNNSDLAIAAWQFIFGLFYLIGVIVEK